MQEPAVMDQGQLARYLVCEAASLNVECAILTGLTEWMHNAGTISQFPGSISRA